MKHWTYGEILEDDDLDWLADHVIDVYSSTTERSAAIPSPHNGQLAYVSGEGLTMFSGMSGGTGGSWKKLVTIPGGGIAGQALIKASDTDYDVTWGTPS